MTEPRVYIKKVIRKTVVEHWRIDITDMIPKKILEVEDLEAECYPYNDHRWEEYADSYEDGGEVDTQVIIAREDDILTWAK